MLNFNLDNSPLYENFEGLQYGETVYSKKYGLGQVHAFYNEDIVIWFSGFKKRFSVEDKEIRRIPDDYFVGRSKKVKVNYEGKEISYREYRKITGLTRKGKKEEKLKHITFKEVAEILGVSKTVLFKEIAMNNIKTKTFARSVMIHREDFLKMYKKFNRNKKN